MAEDSSRELQIKVTKILNALKSKNNQLKGELDDLQIMYDNLVEHGTFIENELEAKNNRINQLLSSMKNYLPPQLYESIVSGTTEVKLSHKRQKLTVFFSDIVNFTEVTDVLEPETLSKLLNQYLNDMSEIALKYGGTIDKFIGDSVMVFFGDPVFISDEVHAKNCILMALGMLEKTRILGDEWLGAGVQNGLSVRMGINTGFCTVGNFGSENRMDYTIIGSQVNIASRLESIAEPNSVFISGTTYSFVKDIVDVEGPNTTRVKGVHHPVEVYKVLRLKPEFVVERDSFLSQTTGGFDLKPMRFSKDTASRDETQRMIISLERALRYLKNS
jgi:adenylate cyclase